MEKAKFTIAPIIYISLLIVGLIICYFTGKVVMDTMVDVDKLPWVFKGLTVFLGGLLWCGIGFVIIICIAGYEEFKQFFK